VFCMLWMATWTSLSANTTWSNIALISVIHTCLASLHTEAVVTAHTTLWRWFKLSAEPRSKFPNRWLQPIEK
jgi:hypothetical protein